MLFCYMTGGLLNASMGNITELIVSLVALKNGLLRIVQVIGSFSDALNFCYSLPAHR
jgi:calcium/proton exchanger cax